MIMPFIQLLEKWWLEFQETQIGITYKKHKGQLETTLNIF